MVKHKLLKNIHAHSLNLLNHVYTVMFVVEIAIENAKLVILEQLVLTMFLALSKQWWVQIRTFSRENYMVFYKNQNVIYVFHDFFLLILFTS